MAPDLEQIPKTYEDACLTLARSHAEEHGFPVRVMCFPDPAEQDVRLVEISDSFPGNPYVSIENGHPGQPALAVPVVRLRPSADFPFRSSVALVTVEEWNGIVAGELAIGEHWELDKHYQIWPK